MIITSIKIRKLLNTGSKLEGIADLTLDDTLVLHDIKILKNNGEMFLAMPSRKSSKGFRDVFHPICAELRNKMEEILFALFTIAKDSSYSILEFENINKVNRTIYAQRPEDFDIVMKF